MKAQRAPGEPGARCGTCGKGSYPSVERAEEAMRHALMDRGAVLHWYWSDACRTIHLTSQPEDDK